MLSVSFKTVHCQKLYPLTISRGTQSFSENLFVFVSDGTHTGVGELSPAVGSDWTAPRGQGQIEALAASGLAANPHDNYRNMREAKIDPPAMAALDVALWDLLAKQAGMPLYRMLGLPKGTQPTSVTIGINPPEITRERVPEILRTSGAKCLKIKLGSPQGRDFDKEHFMAAAEAAKPFGPKLRVDANGGWTVGEAKQMCAWLAERGVDYVEQPLVEGAEDGLPEVFENRPLAIFVDESIRFSPDVNRVADRVDGINLKLMKCGGITEAVRIVATAQSHGLKTMIGCMSETSVAISAGAAIGALFDYIDLDSQLNMNPDPASGAELIDGVVTPTDAPDTEPPSMLDRDQKLAIFMEGSVLGMGSKMGLGILRYSLNDVACVIDSTTAGHDMKELTSSPRSCPIVATIDEAVALGAQVFVLGIAPPGGLIPSVWFSKIDEAVGHGMSVVNGLHNTLAPSYRDLKHGQWIWDIRVEPQGLKPGTGAASALKNRRLLIVGTDMAVGKMTAGLEIYRLARERGVNAEFVATGQIGITIMGSGVPLDAVRVDFAAGAIEREIIIRQEADLIVVEGQGSLGHPGSTANLPLLHGAMPTHLVLCHRAGQKNLSALPHIPTAPIGDLIRLYEDLASVSGIFPRPSTVGVAMNTAHIKSDEEALKACQDLEQQVGLPCVDTVRHGPERLVEAVMR